MTEKAKKQAVYKFVSNSPYLFVGVVNAQFREGEFETEEQAVADYLRVLEDVKEIK
jgi:hypothetical protein